MPIPILSYFQVQDVRLILFKDGLLLPEPSEAQKSFGPRVLSQRFNRCCAQEEGDEWWGGATEAPKTESLIVSQARNVC